MSRTIGWTRAGRLSRTFRRKADVLEAATELVAVRQWGPVALSLSSILLLLVFTVPAACGQDEFTQNGFAVPSQNPAGGATHPLSFQVRQARNLLETGQPQKAIPLLRQAISKNPADGDSHLLLGIALSAIPRRSEALQELSKAVILEPESAVAWFSLGNAQARFAELAPAQKAYENAVRLDPSFVQARVNLALVLAQQNQLPSAEENLRAANAQLGEKPAAAYSHYLLGRVLSQRNEPDRALTELRTATRLKPDYEQAYLATGMAQIALRNDRAAVQALEKAVRLSPADIEAEYQLGGALLRLGQAAQAVPPLEKTVTARPDNRPARYQLCQSLRKAGRGKDAMNCMQKLRVLISKENAAAQSTSATGFNNQGVSLEKAGNLKAAIASYRAAVNLEPAQPVFRRNLALALCRQGQWDEGVAELRKVLRQAPGDTEATQALYIGLDHLKKEAGRASSSAAVSKAVPP